MKRRSRKIIGFYLVFYTFLYTCFCLHDIRIVSKKENEKKNSRFWRNRFRITVQEESTFQERKALLLSGRYIVGVIGGSVVLVALCAYFFVAHTPLTKYVVPGYVAQSYHEDANTAKDLADSALKQLELHEKYLRSIRVILEGGIPDFTEAANLDSVLQSASNLPDPSDNDKELRIRVEEEDRFALKRSGPDVGGETGFSFSPLNGVVSDGFDLSNGHLGIDIVAAEGELIHSVDDGVVLISTYTAENGYVVVVQHGNSRTSVYKHNSALFKEVGDVVQTGDPIAAVGSSGNESTGPHLHFEWWVKGRPVDPAPWLGE